MRVVVNHSESRRVVQVEEGWCETTLRESIAAKFPECDVSEVLIQVYDKEFETFLDLSPDTVLEDKSRIQLVTKPAATDMGRAVMAAEVMSELTAKKAERSDPRPLSQPSGKGDQRNPHIPPSLKRVRRQQLARRTEDPESSRSKHFTVAATAPQSITGTVLTPLDPGVAGPVASRNAVLHSLNRTEWVRRCANTSSPNNEALAPESRRALNVRPAIVKTRNGAGAPDKPSARYADGARAEPGAPAFRRAAGLVSGGLARLPMPVDSCSFEPSDQCGYSDSIEFREPKGSVRQVSGNSSSRSERKSRFEVASPRV
ncbi:uncharacterized protein ISCGN_024383 [Ixodes scapularis]